jgi:hypothetical protein
MTKTFPHFLIRVFEQKLKELCELMKKKAERETVSNLNLMSRTD